MEQAFLAPPLHSRDGEGFETVCTTVYRPAAGRMHLARPRVAPWPGRLDRFAEGRRTITFVDGAAPREEPALPGQQPEDRPASAH